MLLSRLDQIWVFVFRSHAVWMLLLGIRYLLVGLLISLDSIIPLMRGTVEFDLALGRRVIAPCILNITKIGRLLGRW
jgi:hypothetical protein